MNGPLDLGEQMPLSFFAGHSSLFEFCSRIARAVFAFTKKPRRPEVHHETRKERKHEKSRRTALPALFVFSFFPGFVMRLLLTRSGRLFPAWGCSGCSAASSGRNRERHASAAGRSRLRAGVLPHPALRKRRSASRRGPGSRSDAATEVDRRGRQKWPTLPSPPAWIRFDKTWSGPSLVLEMSPPPTKVTEKAGEVKGNSSALDRLGLLPILMVSAEAT